LLASTLHGVMQWAAAMRLGAPSTSAAQDSTDVGEGVHALAIKRIGEADQEFSTEVRTKAEICYERCESGQYCPHQDFLRLRHSATVFAGIAGA
jgi:hypothetical protein